MREIMYVGRVMFLKPLAVVIAGLVSGWVATSCPVFADSEQANPIAVEMSLSTNTSIQGDPIALHYLITNAKGQNVQLHMGRNKEEWFTVKVTDAYRQTIPANIDLPSPMVGGVSVSNPVIPSGGTLPGSIEVNHWVTFPHPGTYTLNVQVRLPCTFGLQDGTRSEEPLPTLSFTQNYTFKLMITPSNHSHLKSVAEELGSSLLNSRDINQNAATVQSLFSMPEADASPIWQALASDSSLDVFARQNIIRQLFHLHSSKAYDILGDVARDPNQGVELQQSASLYMDSMYRNGDANLKKHIEDWYSARGFKIPALPLLQID